MIFASIRILGIEPHLDRRAVRRARRVTGERAVAGGLPHHPLHQIDAEHRLGDRMLDLQTRIDFEEIEILALDVVDELHGAGGLVVDALPERDGGLMQPRAHLFGDARCRRLLDHLLIAPLQRAIALAEPDNMPLAVAEDLHLDVPRHRDEALEIDASVAEAGARGALHGGEALAQRCFVVAELHADAAAAGGALQHQRKADPRRFRQRVLDRIDQPSARQ
jgi:hypothetical protein